MLDNISKQTFSNIINEDTKKYLKKISTPTLLIWGTLDKTTPLKDGIKTNKLLINSNLIKIDNVGHFPHLEKPNLINNILTEIYKEVVTLITY
jgi:pimeloyl-ACP methyl ester carboxylesterase